jgi:hypothetical protein
MDCGVTPWNGSRTPVNPLLSRFAEVRPGPFGGALARLFGGVDVSCVFQQNVSLDGTGQCIVGLWDGVDGIPPPHSLLISLAA